MKMPKTRNEMVGAVSLSVLAIVFLLGLISATQQAMNPSNSLSEANAELKRDLEKQKANP